MTASIIPIRKDWAIPDPWERRKIGVMLMAVNISPFIRDSRDITRLVKVFGDTLNEYSKVSRRQFKKDIS